MKKKLAGQKDTKDAKDGKDSKDDEKAVDDSTDELGLRTKSGERLYRIYKLVDAKPPTVINPSARRRFIRFGKSKTKPRS